MKKIILALGLGFTLATGAFAADNVLEQLNSQVVSILTPFQNDNTVAQLTFGALETNSERAVKVVVDGLYRKLGSQNMFEVKVDNLSYNYGDGLTPTTIFRGSLGVDFTKLLPTNQINELIPVAAEEVEGLAKSYLAEFGDALSIRSVVTSMTKDDNGNYTGLTALISVKFDLSKLPEEIKSEDIIATDAVVSLTLNVKTGVMIDSYVVSNPNYIGFKENQEGLKEELDKLLARDEEELAKIESLAQTLDNIADQIVEYSNSLKQNKSKIGTKKKAHNSFLDTLFQK